jgi:hypothetical protein
MAPVLRMRGIYVTALTRFFLDRGFKVALPSGPIADRFGGSAGFDTFQAPDAQILDLDSKQGILVAGEEGVLDDLLTQVRDAFFDAVIRRKAKDVLEIEFPLVSKSRLDEIRSTVLLTLPLHHRLKIIASDQVDFAEEKILPHHPEMRESLSRDMERELIWNRYERGREVAIEHVKPDGRVLHLSEGEIVEADFARKRLVLKRFKFKGRSKYDGLGIPKQEGDYAVSEIREGDWYFRHTYFRTHGERIGSYYNINTPVEFYPDRIRYVDLEIDVVQFADGRVAVVDEGELDKQFDAGRLSAELRGKSKHEAYVLTDSLLKEQSATLPSGQEA